MTTISLPLPAKQKLRSQYSERVDVYEKVLYEFQRRLKQTLHRIGIPATIKYRVKGFDSLYEKVLRKLKSTGQQEGVVQLTDLLGLRVVCAFIEDLNKAEDQIRQSLQVIEVERKGSNFTVKEFGYESTHYLVRVPDDIVDSFHVDADVVCEIQLRTILQDAWAEVEHELVYKAEFTPFDEPLRRKLAALNANLSLSDIIFQEIRDYQRQLHHELRRRRDLVMEWSRKTPRASCVSPRGAFYAFPRLDIPESDETFVRGLLAEKQVLVVHGEGFGQAPGTKHIRIVFLPPESVLEQALQKITTYISTRWP